MSGSTSFYTGSAPTPTSIRGGGASLTINGVAVDVTEFSYDPSSYTNDPAIGMNGPQGFTRKPKYGGMEFTIRDAGGLSVGALWGLSGVPIVAVLNSGKTVYGDNMSPQEPEAVNTAEATLRMRWFGQVSEGTV